MPQSAVAPSKCLTSLGNMSENVPIKIPSTLPTKIPKSETISQPEATPSNTPASLVLLASPSTLDAPSTASAIPIMTPAPSQISDAPFPKTINISSLKKEHCKICNLTVIGNFNKHLLNSHYKEELRIAIPSETRSCASCNNSKFSSYAEAIFHFMTKHNICRKFYDKEQM